MVHCVSTTQTQENGLRLILLCQHPGLRVLPTVLSQPTCLIVAGGFIHITDSRRCTNIVEVFSTSTSQWSQADSLPIGVSIACVNQSGGVSNGMVYLIGGDDWTNRLQKTFVAPLDKLLSRTSNTPNQDPDTQSKDKSLNGVG